MDSSVTSYGQCRCCLAVGNHRSLFNEYYENGVEEVYFNIVLDCFNIFLSSYTGLSMLICTSCIRSLRDANNFKSMIMRADQQLLSNKVAGNTVLVDVPALDLNVRIKEEMPKVKSEPLEEINDNFDSFKFDLSPESTDESINSNESIQVKGELELLARYPRVPSLPTRESLYTTCLPYVRLLDSLKGRKVTSKTIEKTIKSRLKKSLNANNKELVTERTAHLDNLNSLLKHTNLTPFRKRITSLFTCFYCLNTFDDMKLLKEHIKIHKDAKIRRHIGTHGVENTVVYAEVSDLKCTLCDQKLPTLKEIKEHLTERHNKTIHKHITDRIIPFTYDNEKYECQECNFYFDNFISLERHVSIHNRNFVCEQCGGGFITKRKVEQHIKSSHGPKVYGVFHCTVCEKIFDTKDKRKSHVNGVHKTVKRHKCPICSERFFDYLNVQKHLVEFHGKEKRFQCTICEKSYHKRDVLALHMRKAHTNERTVSCDLCSYRCFTNFELRTHKIKHSGEKNFICSLCDKAYARKKTLREHMKIHLNIRKFTCSVCGQAFVQNCSLKGHMKTHHSD